VKVNSCCKIINIEEGRRMTIRLIVILLLAVPLSGCVVTQGTHRVALAKIQNLQGEKDGLLNKVAEVEATLDKTGKELQALTENFKATEMEKKAASLRIKQIETELEAKTKEVAKLKAEVDEVRVAKDKEIDEIKFKIKEVQARAAALLEKIEEIQQ